MLGSTLVSPPAPIILEKFARSELTLSMKIVWHYFLKISTKYFKFWRNAENYATPYASSSETVPVPMVTLPRCIGRWITGPRDGGRKFLLKNLFSLDFGGKIPIQEGSSLTDF
jgi:hypothetical protein